MSPKLLAGLLLLVGALPLPLYPFVLMTDLMHVAHAGPAGLAGMPPATLVFVAGGAFYPLVYLVAFAAAVWHLAKGQRRAALVWSAVPVALLAAVAVAFTLSGNAFDDDDERGPVLQVEATGAAAPA